MTEQNVTCSKCGHEFPLTTAPTADIEATFRSQFTEREKELRAAFELQTEEAKAFAAAEATRKAAADVETELTRLRGDLADRQNKLSVARQTEFELRKAQRDQEDQKAELALEVERRIAVERGSIAATIEQRLRDEHANKERERDLQLDGLRRQVEDMQRRLEGVTAAPGRGFGAPSRRAGFPVDAVAPVPKGIRGADLCQRFTNSFGQACGVIVWEVKDTKAWNADWLQKLKDDVQTVKGDVAVLVTTTLPDGVSHFQCIDGVWVTSFALAIPLAAALRAGLVELAAQRRASVGKNEKMEVLYAYLTGSEFRLRVSTAVETFRDMREDFEGEKRAIQKLWAKRDKQLVRICQSITATFGDLQGIAGQALPDVTVMELPAASQA